ncbi:TetR/AcrR family transcriptional regulator [Aquihabitans sp. McL0605]|uniref:TetR/AcrR family transcriptional regulator n=1 Tax=Aquihabitans sp. McL0605 TaxID=3415671 RepID=UPI003CF184AF
MPPEPAPARRRTQDERRTATRQAILDAAAGRLVEGGLDGVTIAAVAKAAGVSSGAVHHHFGNKLELILALTNHLSDASRDAVVHSTDTTAPIEERVSQMIDTIMAAVFDPATRAQFELHTAARIDPALAQQLNVLNARSAEVYVADLAGVLIEAQVEPIRVLAAVELSLCAAIGLSLLTISGTDPAIEQRLADSLKAHILSEIALAAEPG